MIKIRTEQVIDVGDWDSLVSKTYGKRYNFQQQDGCKSRGNEYITVPEEHPWDYPNDTVPEVINGDKMGVSFAAWLARDNAEWNGKEDDRKFLALFWERNFYPNVDMVANGLHAKGLLPAGTYTIDIDW